MRRRKHRRNWWKIYFTLRIRVSPSMSSSDLNKESSYQTLFLHGTILLIATIFIATIVLGQLATRVISRAHFWCVVKRYHCVTCTIFRREPSFQWVSSTAKATKHHSWTLYSSDITTSMAYNDQMLFTVWRQAAKSSTYSDSLRIILKNSSTIRAECKIFLNLGLTS